jgi:hypothetical protein
MERKDRSTKIEATSTRLIALLIGGSPSIRTKALSRAHLPSGFATAFFAREVEDQDSASHPAKSAPSGTLGNLTLNHFAVDLRSTNHRFGLTINHDSAMRTSRLYGMRERPINSIGLACADQGHPRAALDANDLWIPCLGAQHPVESYG